MMLHRNNATNCILPPRSCAADDGNRQRIQFERGGSSDWIPKWFSSTGSLTDFLIISTSFYGNSDCSAIMSYWNNSCQWDKSVMNPLWKWLHRNKDCWVVQRVNRDNGDVNDFCIEFPHLLCMLEFYPFVVWIASHNTVIAKYCWNWEPGLFSFSP